MADDTITRTTQTTQPGDRTGPASYTRTSDVRTSPPASNSSGMYFILGAVVVALALLLYFTMGRDDAVTPATDTTPAVDSTTDAPAVTPAPDATATEPAAETETPAEIPATEAPAEIPATEAPAEIPATDAPAEIPAEPVESN